MMLYIEAADRRQRVDTAQQLRLMWLAAAAGFAGDSKSIDAQVDAILKPHD